MTREEMLRISQYEGRETYLDRWDLYRLGWQDWTIALFLRLPDKVAESGHTHRVYWSSRRVNEARERARTTPAPKVVPTRFEREPVI